MPAVPATGQSSTTKRGRPTRRITASLSSLLLVAGVLTLGGGLVTAPAASADTGPVN